MSSVSPTLKIRPEDSFYGFLYVKDYDDTKALPIYDFNGYIAGLQALIPSKMKGYNSRNETINLPPIEVQPPIFKIIFNKKIQMYAITVYFKHPHLVCSPILRDDVIPGKGLYIQNGDPETEFIKIPMDSRDLDPIWKPGTCRPKMGLHYFMNLTSSLPCEKIYPVFLMYDIEGKLSAFGWSFQGKPMDLSPLKWFHLTPKVYPFVFESKKLPACMFTPKFSIFGLHIYLRSPKSKLMLCGRSKHQQQQHNATSAPRQKVTYNYKDNKKHHHEGRWSQVITVKPNIKPINNSNRLCLIDFILLFSILLITRTLQICNLQH